MTSQTNIRVAVHGAAGRVGREVLRAVGAASDMTLTAAIDRIPQANLDPLPVHVPYFTDVRDALSSAPSDVIVDFSLPDMNGVMRG